MLDRLTSLATGAKTAVTPARASPSQLASADARKCRAQSAVAVVLVLVLLLSCFSQNIACDLPFTTLVAEPEDAKHGLHGGDPREADATRYSGAHSVRHTALQDHGFNVEHHKSQPELVHNELASATRPAANADEQSDTMQRESIERELAYNVARINSGFLLHEQQSSEFYFHVVGAPWFDFNLTARLQSQAVPELQHTTVLVLGDSLDAYMLGMICGCPRLSSEKMSPPQDEHHTCSGKIDSKTLTCHDLRNNFTFGVARQPYSTYPFGSAPNYHYPKWLSNTTDIARRYEELLLAQVEGRMRQPDIMIVNLNLWVLQRTHWFNRDYERFYNDPHKHVKHFETITHNITRFINLAKDLFKPKAVFVHGAVSSAPERSQRRKFLRPEIINHNRMLSIAAQDTGSFFVDLEAISAEQDRLLLLQDDIHPSRSPLEEFGNIFINLLARVLHLNAAAGAAVDKA